jgi:hypothetical protein
MNETELKSVIEEYVYQEIKAAPMGMEKHQII